MQNRHFVSAADTWSHPDKHMAGRDAAYISKSSISDGSNTSQCCWI